jgi:hypothetical protein
MNTGDYYIQNEYFLMTDEELSEVIRKALEKPPGPEPREVSPIIQAPLDTFQINRVFVEGLEIVKGVQFNLDAFGRALQVGIEGHFALVGGDAIGFGTTQGGFVGEIDKTEFEKGYTILTVNRRSLRRL